MGSVLPVPIYPIVWTQILYAAYFLPLPPRRGGYANALNARCPPPAGELKGVVEMCHTIGFYRKVIARINIKSTISIQIQLVTIKIYSRHKTNQKTTNEK